MCISYLSAKCSCHFSFNVTAYLSSLPSVRGKQVIMQTQQQNFQQPQQYAQQPQQYAQQPGQMQYPPQQQFVQQPQFYQPQVQRTMPKAASMVVFKGAQIGQIELTA